MWRNTKIPFIARKYLWPGSCQWILVGNNSLSGLNFDIKKERDIHSRSFLQYRRWSKFHQQEAVERNANTLNRGRGNAQP